MLFASASTGVRQGHVAGFPAIRTVVEPVRRQAHVVLAFADDAVLLAGAALFRHVAHRAMDGTRHGSLQGKLYLTMAMCGKTRVLWMRRVVYSPRPHLRRFFQRFARFVRLRLLIRLVLSCLSGCFSKPQ